MFKSHVAKVIPLRKCEPAVDTAILRELPVLFPLPAEDFALDPEFEPTYARNDPTKTKVFAKLQALNRVHLVTAVDVWHMFDAAMQSKSCRLTASGRYYWRLAKDHRI